MGKFVAPVKPTVFSNVVFKRKAKKQHRIATFFSLPLLFSSCPEQQQHPKNMTVASLWKTLNKAGCGKKVGERELVSGQTTADLARVNPWNYNQLKTTTKRQTLAVDLSIWICESMTSQGMAEQHTNPSLYLVFSRTVKLLNLGIKLIFVVEGKSRVRTDMGEDDHFRKRRSGTRFWKACNDCQKMLELLGVPVVRAKAEGEALCALLSRRGIVDGVISNDGDCLLFGAKTIYTKFSNENLDNGDIIRYDSDDLRAVVENADDEDSQAANQRKQEPHEEQINLSQQDLVVFALLTGSDIVGSGLAKVGHKKAIRFIRKCKSDNPLSTSTAALDEMSSWARSARVECVHVDGRYEGELQVQTDIQGEGDPKTKKSKTSCCSRCCHAGTKRNHRKHGCEVCGTQPGEPCFKVTSDDRFRKSIRTKALEMEPRFEPSKVLAAYTSPNGNQIPLQFSNLPSSGIQLSSPRLSAIMRMKLIIKGKSYDPSRSYLQQAVGRLLARAELLPTDHDHRDFAAPQQGNGDTAHAQRERPVPKLIEKALTQKGVACYQVLWFVNATVTDQNGDGIDGYEYVSVESQELIDKRYPDMVSAFYKAEVERQKQGDGEKERRKEFLTSFLIGPGHANEEAVPPNEDKKKRRKKKKKRKIDEAREGFFVNKVGWQPNQKTTKAIEKKDNSEDIAHLLRFVTSKRQRSFVPTSPVRTSRKKRRHENQEQKSLGSVCQENRQRGDDMSSLADGSATGLVHQSHCSATPKREPLSMLYKSDCPPLPSARELFCNMGDFLVPLTPLQSHRGVFPPPHIWVFE